MLSPLKELKQKLLNSELIKGSITLFLLLNLFNFLHYVFQFSMARLLGPIEYGAFAALMSIVYLLAVPSEAVQLIASRYTSLLQSENNLGRIKGLIKKLMIRGITIAVILYIASIPLLILFSHILDIDFEATLFMSTFVFFAFIAPINRGVLQGQKKFISLGIVSVVEALLKVIIAVVLVLIGWKIYGAITGLILGIAVSFIISFIFIKPILRATAIETKTDGGRAYSFSVFFLLFIVNAMIALDTVFAKYFFSPQDAGTYAIASLFGKMIFLGLFPISKAMFPLASETIDRAKAKRTLFSSLKIVFLISSISLLGLALVPELVITLLFGKSYLIVADILWIVGLATTFLAFGNLLLIYFLSQRQVKLPYVLLVFPVLQIGLFILFHQTLLAFSIALAASTAALLAFSIILVERHT